MEPAHVLFAHVTEGPDDEIDLAAATLLIAEVEYPGLDVAHYLQTIDTMAEAVRAQPGPAPDPLLSGLNGYLYDELGFHGNDEDYYDPKNSFLNEVIDRRTGIPISLSVLFMEVGWRLGMDLEGVSFPGHFLVRYRRPDGDEIIDPYHRGLRLDTAELEQRLRQVLGEGAQLGPEHLPAAGKRQILTRLLNNLRGIYQRSGDATREAGVLERLAILNPQDARVAEALEALKKGGGTMN